MGLRVVEACLQPISSRTLPAAIQTVGHSFNRTFFGANGALPWLVFVRDRKLLEIKFPELEIETIEPMMPLRYLLSGGVSMRSLVPGVLYGPCKALEKAASHWNHKLGMFALFCIRKTS